MNAATIQSTRLGAMIRKLNGNPALRISAFEFDENIWLFNLEVWEGFQNRGIGSEAIRQLQQCGKPIALVPMSLDGRLKDLERFYQRLGFVWVDKNKMMIWKPS